MSPRSEEFMSDARARLAAARTNLEADLPFVVVGQAYYAMLYAARAALSEEDLYAKTHSGLWSLFSQTFVKPGRFEVELSRPVDDIRRQRELADYEATDPTEAQAADALAHAERFVAAIDRMLS